ncbi:MAG: DUF3597 domain-containing protein, partial [Hyphomicrobiaceae bacterium]
MSIFGAIRDAIFGGPAAAAEAPSAEVAAATPAATAQAAPAATPTAAAAPSVGTQAPAASGKAAAPVDVAAVLDKLDENADEDLDWRVSIVDLMKLLGMDSSLKARKQLAQELKYTGDTSDSAKMNVWLHKQVMS